MGQGIWLANNFWRKPPIHNIWLIFLVHLYYFYTLVFILDFSVEECSKKCTNGHCILKYSFETCHCASGFTPSPYQEPWGYEQCFPVNGTCKLYSNETLCPAQSQCLQLSSGRFPKHRCVCNPGYGFGRVYSDNCCKKGCVRKFHKECMRKLLSLNFSLFLFSIEIALYLMGFNLIL